MRALILLLLIFSASSSFSSEVETLIWNMKPLSITLPISKEKIITFNQPTKLQIPNDLLEHMEYTILEDKYYYLTAKKPFKSKRTFAISENGKQIIIELSASTSSGNSNQTNILTKEDAIKAVQENTESAVSNQSHDLLKPTMSINDYYVVMMRFASQQLYAPKRLIPANDDLSRVRVPNLPQPIFKGQPELETRPIAQWRSKSTGLFVTAMNIKNTAHYGMTLDPRNIRGQFKTASLQHGYLTSVEFPDSSSALYLISDKPFIEAMGQWATN